MQTESVTDRLNVSTNELDVPIGLVKTKSRDATAPLSAPLLNYAVLSSVLLLITDTERRRIKPIQY